MMDYLTFVTLILICIVFILKKETVFLSRMYILLSFINKHVYSVDFCC